jgi:hypothetical protein
VLANWQGHQATIFNGVHVWSGDASKAAGAAVEAATKAMQGHAKQLRDAIAWCNTSATTIVVAKDTITSNVAAAQQEIQTIEKTAAKNNQNPDGAIQTLVQREYKENAGVVNTFAMAWGAKPEDIPLSPSDRPGQPGDIDAKGSGEQRPAYVVKPGSDGADFSPAPSPQHAAPVVSQGVPGADGTGFVHGPGPAPRPAVEQVVSVSKPGDGARGFVESPPVGAPPAGGRPIPAPVAPPAAGGTGPSPAGPAPSAPSIGGGPSGSPGISSPSSPMSSTSSPSSSSTASPAVQPTSAGSGTPATDARAAAGAPPTGTSPQTAPLTNQFANTPLAAQPSVPAPPPAPAPIPDAPAPTPTAPPPSAAPGAHAAPPPPPVGAAPGAGAPPAPSMPLGPPPTPPPAGPLAPPSSAAPAPTSMGPGVAPASVAGATSAVGAPAPVPVSATRA